MTQVLLNGVDITYRPRDLPYENSLNVTCIMSQKVPTIMQQLLLLHDMILDQSGPCSE